MNRYPDARVAIVKSLEKLLDLGVDIYTENWQAIKVSTEMRELFEHSFVLPIEMDLEKSSAQCMADQPWCNVHFKERISGQALNPGESYKIWPYYSDDEKWRTEKADGRKQEKELFSHTYMERFWPKWAGKARSYQMKGIRYKYGDLKDVIDLLRRDIHTRQAFLPIWFPEDTGSKDNQRVPCTLGYLFNYRSGYLHCTYYIRSCDTVRHFHNDIYLTNALAAYVINDLNRYFLGKPKIHPGNIYFHCTSLHVFKNDLFALRKKLKELQK